ncbi:GvpL/GvpF family gas vesicle protein [Streptomyces caniscabiei]|uniref:GvpL/GvpF family gas vesicle protein n=1 Tax=Streptomyces caniscabiei TaxID=2746961 RepID=A0A927QER8_9ACTN|nr:GvpL/GvpF family gas vesicle protein [Streptomyces caniscabiei]MBD9723656.1 GvpL/GvpF family gas vesicle protein [Streptomyces caniscabiei]MDX3511146.1 GvpL/GvpF family gas vesicle protein [Streptomyces caniscabiei]MDX3721226.1 GvpL/GvpF family gas vesicle protein [Streptomyces caniscabiei]WEO27222.1 GvpL/GvpF family gas vesicle protein [Streptomyces caniscabiei]
MTGEHALYVYALLRSETATTCEVTGLDGCPTRLVHAPGTGIAALVHDAPATPYQGSDDQVRRWVRQQNEVVTTVWERTGSVLPMTFNVLVADESSDESSDEPSPAGGSAGGRKAADRLTEWIAERAAEIDEQLRTLADRCELRVEMALDRRALGATPAPHTDAASTHRSAGMRRLLAKQEEHSARQTAERLADQVHAEVRGGLLAIAEDLRDRGRTQQSPDETHVLSVALLTRQEDIDTVGGVLSELQARQPAVRIRFLGPWPPYSFTELPDPPTAAALLAGQPSAGGHSDPP